MLIELDLSLHGAPLSLQEVDALENIGSVASLGYHLLIGSRQSLLAASQVDGLSRRARVAFQTALRNATQNYVVRGKVDAELFVSNAVYAPIFNGRWELPLSDLAIAGFLSKPVLLAENASDARFYIALATMYARRAALPLPVALQPDGGGGSTMPGVLSANYVAGGKPVLCIADSDREWSADAAGLVAQGCRAVLPSDTWMCRFRDNIVRTIENLLPVSWIRKTDFFVSNRALCEAVERIQSVASRELAEHSNLKSQKCICHYAYAVSAPARSAFAADVLALGGIGACAAGTCSTSFQFGGIQGAVAQVAEFVLQRPADAARLIEESSVQLVVGRAVFSFGIGTIPIRA